MGRVTLGGQRAAFLSCHCASQSPPPASSRDEREIHLCLCPPACALCRLWPSRLPLCRSGLMVNLESGEEEHRSPGRRLLLQNAHEQGSCVRSSHGHESQPRCARDGQPPAFRSQVCQAPERTRGGAGVQQSSGVGGGACQAARTVARLSTGRTAGQRAGLPAIRTSQPRVFICDGPLVGSERPQCSTGVVQGTARCRQEPQGHHLCASGPRASLNLFSRGGQGRRERAQAEPARPRHLFLDGVESSSPDGTWARLASWSWGRVPWLGQMGEGGKAWGGCGPV